MSTKTKQVLRNVHQRLSRCFFCNTNLLPPRNCRDIFKTLAFPLDRKVSDLIGKFSLFSLCLDLTRKTLGDLLDIPMDENSVHSRYVCGKCFSMVSEFSELESRAGEIRTDMFASYTATKETLEGQVAKIEEDDTSQEGEETTTIKLDAEKLNQLVAEASGGSLKLKPGSSGEQVGVMIVRLN